MAYSALIGMREKNNAYYGLDNTVSIPDLPLGMRNYGLEALKFLRDDCTDLKFDSGYADLTDYKGRSIKQGTIPFNMERDLDRLCFERALIRFLKSGSREDAFDIYYCYCEIFHPFGGGYKETGIMLQMLTDHEYNASSLLLKHRDHYSHSVYVFCIGLAIYRNHKAFREAYNKQYGLEEGKAAAHHFLEFWGLTSLFHDVGYPFEIAHQQMKDYVCKLDKAHNDEKKGFAPYITYNGMEYFWQSCVGDLNDLFAQAITDRLAEKYLPRTRVAPYVCHNKLREVLRDRAVHKDPATKEYMFMDHAYFSGLILAKNFLEHRTEIDIMSEKAKPVMDSLCAIILHNSLFRFTMRKFLYTKERLQLDDGQPLTYLLMLCDELQCWGRTRYGKNTRRKIYAFDFDMEFCGNQIGKVTYFYDERHENDGSDRTNFEKMKCQGYDARQTACADNRSKFLDEIDEIVALDDVIDGFVSDRAKPYTKDYIEPKYSTNNKHRTLTLSDSNYLSLYQFAISLHGRHSKIPVEEADKMEEQFETELSLEYKLSNVAQAKRYAEILENIGCFYTDRAVAFEPVDQFEKKDLDVISEEEHKLWCIEKQEMGWQPGNDHTDSNRSGEERQKMRECTRRHDALGSYMQLNPENKEKNSDAMKKMLQLLQNYNGLTIYKLDLDPNGHPTKLYRLLLTKTNYGL